MHSRTTTACAQTLRGPKIERETPIPEESFCPCGRRFLAETHAPGGVGAHWDMVCFWSGRHYGRGTARVQDVQRPNTVQVPSLERRRRQAVVMGKVEVYGVGLRVSHAGLTVRDLQHGLRIGSR